MRKLLIVGLTLALVFSFACGGGDDASETATTTSSETSSTAQAKAAAEPTKAETSVNRSGGILLRSDPFGVPHSDPYSSKNGGASPGWYLSSAHNRLVEYAKPFNPTEGPVFVPSLATDWNVSDDGTEWTFNLQRGVQWHDGENFDSADVVATFERILDPEQAISPRVAVGLRKFLKSVTAVDDDTVVFDTGDEPSAVFLSYIANWYVPISPDHLIRGSGDEKWNFIEPLSIGTGPFIMKEHDPTTGITFERNPNYWQKDDEGNQLPYLDGINVTVEKDRTRVIAKFVTGQVHMTNPFYGLSVEEAEALVDQAGGKDKAVVYPQAHGFFYLMMNKDLPPFDNPKVREAVHYAVNQQQMFDKVLGAGIAGRWVNPEMAPEAAISAEEFKGFAWNDFGNYSANVEKAKSLLAEAGHPDGIDLAQPILTSRFPLFENMYGIVVDQLREAGFRGETQAPESAVSRQMALDGQFSYLFGARGVTLLDATNGIILGATSFAPAVGSKPYAWDGQEKVDALYQTANRTLDTQQRGMILKDLERFLQSPDLPVIPIGWTIQSIPTYRCVQNWIPGPGNFGQEHTVTWLLPECR